MIRLATTDDFQACNQLLKELNPALEVDPEHLYLSDNSNGFTIVMLAGSQIIGMSTFSIRRKNYSNEMYRLLYWENLIVDKKYRDGTAYLALISYLRKLVKTNVYSDVYFLVRRKQVLDLHKKARFKNFGYVGLCFDGISIGYSIEKHNNVTTLSYEEFREKITSPQDKDKIALAKFRGFEGVSAMVIERQLKFKHGKVVLDHETRNVHFIRALFKNRLLSVNLIIPGHYTDNAKRVPIKSNSVLNINFRLVKSENESYTKGRFFILKYHALSFTQIVKFDSLEIWEHDAW